MMHRPTYATSSLKYGLALLIAALTASACAQLRPLRSQVTKAAVEPRPFKSDACTWWPDGSWSACCVEHDRKYWLGGTWRERLAADRALATCVSQHQQPGLAALMFAVLRISGVSWLPTSFRWGNGWPYSQHGPQYSTALPRP
jgi:hypothetical protein